MRKLTPIEERALQALEWNAPHGLCIGPLDNASKVEAHNTFLSLVKKKRAIIEATDDGPRFLAITDA